MIEAVKMFDYWSFPNDGTVQFFQICEGKVIDYRHYESVQDAPIALLRDDVRYHGEAYVAPVLEGREPE